MPKIHFNADLACQRLANFVLLFKMADVRTSRHFEEENWDGVGVQYFECITLTIFFNIYCHFPYIRGTKIYKLKRQSLLFEDSFCLCLTIPLICLAASDTGAFFVKPICCQLSFHEFRIVDGLRKLVPVPLSMVWTSAI